MSGVDDPFPPRRSPDGTIEVRFDAYEARMSHWVLEPAVVRLRDGRAVVSLSGTAWDGAGPTAYPAPHRVALTLRRYPDGMNAEHLVVDVETETYGLGEGAAPDRPVAELAAELERRFEETVRRRTARYVDDGLCPHCSAQLYVGRRERRRGQVTCVVCERTWPLRG